MAALSSRTAAQTLLRIKPSVIGQKANFGSFGEKHGKKLAWVLGTLAVGGGAAVVANELATPVFASELIVHPSKQQWPHRGLISSFDHASIRRGYQVYKQVCAACHSMQFMYYRMLDGVCMTTEEVKAEAEEIQVEDGPDEDGNMFMRPGKPSDPFPKPYKNEEQARSANNGALPPDLSLICEAREGGEDYIFSILTGYTDTPEGVKLEEGQNYNAYFPGGAIGMAQALYNEIIEYDDGTPATQSQLAKDVTTFLKWAGEPEHDARKLYCFRAVSVMTALSVISYFLYRRTWSTLKTRQIIFKNPARK